MVGKEFRDTVDPDLFASTPPLEGLRYVISMAATENPCEKRKCIMVNDISRACFFAPAVRELYVELPKEKVLPLIEQ